MAQATQETQTATGQPQTGRSQDQQMQFSQTRQPAYEKSPITSSLVEVVDRILDKGLVIDAWIRVSLVGIEILTVEARVVVASVDTYLRYADALAKSKRIGGGIE